MCPQFCLKLNNIIDGIFISAKEYALKNESDLNDNSSLGEFLLAEYEKRVLDNKEEFNDVSREQLLGIFAWRLVLK
jgi:hypothetical protein